MRENKTLEFKENAETNSFLKTISAFANFTNGKIIFGIQDDGTKIGFTDPIQTCLNLENKINDNLKPIPSYTLDILDDNTIELSVFESPFKPYLYKGKAYKRYDSSTIEVDRLEYNRLVLEGLNQSYEEQVSNQQDLQFHKLEEMLQSKLQITTINSDILRTLGLLKNQKFNNAAALVADHNHFNGIDIVRFGKNVNEIMEREIFDHVSIIEMFHKSIEIFERYYIYEEIQGSLRTKKEKIPERAFRETIANAIIHRVWDVPTRIRISMFDDRIEITSCGGLPTGISEQEYLDGQISLLRNPIIGNIFFRLNYIEMFGSGIQRIKESYSNSNLSPQFKIYENSITVILPTIIDNTEISDDEKQILSVLKSNIKLTRAQIEEQTHLNKSKTQRLLKSLVEKNIINKNGAARNTKYNLNIKKS